jgi:CBS domain-containing protein
MPELTAAERGVESPEEVETMKSIKAIIGDRETVVVDPSLSIADAARVMAGRNIGAVPVVDGDRLVGVFSERDILTRVVAVDRSPATTAVRDVMTTELVVAEVSESYEACLARMQQARVRHLIVLDQGRLAGMVSLRDVLAADIDEKAEAITLLNAYVHYIPADVESKLRT